MSELGKTLGVNLVAGEVETKSVTVISGQGILPAGTVLGAVKYTCPTTGVVAGTGNGTMTSVKPGRNAKAGAYVFTAVKPLGLAAQDLIVWNVVNPDGKNIGSVVSGDQTGGVFNFSSDEISCIITGGSTDFAAADTITVTITGGVPTTGSVTGTGNGTVPNVRGGINTKKGVYTGTCIEAIANGGLFNVVNPNGESIGSVYARKYAGTGNGTLTELRAGRNKKFGRYVVTCTVAGVTHGGTFVVTAPDGVVVGSIALPDTATGTVQFFSDDISFKLTDGSTNFIIGDVFTVDVLKSDEMSLEVVDGSTDFIVGDYFTVTVPNGANDVAACVLSNANGSQVARYVLAEAVDATSSAVATAAINCGDVLESALRINPTDSANMPQIINDLRGYGIKALSSVSAPAV